MPILALLVLPFLLLLQMILVLFGQQPDSLIQVYVQSCHFTFSDNSYCQPSDGHYLVTIASHGDTKLVKPLRPGVRRGNVIQVNRQLLVANAFEQWWEDHFPRIHHIIRSTSAQPVIDQLTRLIKRDLPRVKIIVGGVYPTYHWEQILEEQPQIDMVVIGEGEATCVELMKALSLKAPLEDVKGIAYRQAGIPHQTAPAPVIKDLDEHRVGWELMKPYHYTYWGKKKAVVIQFSRGCPYPCNYCGQSLFWKSWRHRDPQKLAEEMTMLYHEYGVRVFNFADENPSTNPRAWKAFLEAVIAQDLPFILVGSIRADNIVRDADFLHLYKKAGFERFLLGIENYDAVVLEKIKKAGSIAKDREAIQLLRQHNILSMATYVVGFAEERLIDYYHSLKQLLSYDPDQIQLLYVTPHKWTPYFDLVKDKEIIQKDQRRWDYKHQVLATENLRPWQVMLLVKLMEFLVQMRPKSLWRVLFHQDARIRDAHQWYYRIGRRVWFYEWFNFLFREKAGRTGIQLKDFWKPFPIERKVMESKRA